MIEYAGLHLTNRVLNKPEFWMCLTVHSIRSLYKLLSSYQDRQTYSEHCQTFKVERFAKKNSALVQMRNQDTLIKISLKTQEKELHRETVWGFFSEKLLKLHFEWKIETKDGLNQGISFKNQHTSKKGKGGLHSLP